MPDKALTRHHRWLAPTGFIPVLRVYRIRIACFDTAVTFDAIVAMLTAYGPRHPYIHLRNYDSCRTCPAGPSQRKSQRRTDHARLSALFVPVD